MRRKDVEDEGLGRDGEATDDERVVGDGVVTVINNGIFVQRVKRKYEPASVPS